MTSQTQTLLQVSALCLKKDRPILENIHFSLNRGEMLVVLGPSGSGKSTLLRCLNRLESATTGTVCLEGRCTEDISARELRRHIGLVFQEPELLPGTVFENLGTGPKLIGETLEENEGLALLESVGLDPAFKNKRSETLSVGEKQRLALAQVLANQPRVLLLDEPTSALDPLSTETVESAILKVQKDNNIGMILVTHDMDQARRMNSATLVLVDGKIAAYGTLDTILQSGATHLIKRFFSKQDKNS